MVYRKTKYVLVSLTALGYLRIEDDRGKGIVFGAEVKTINFLNGARHSVYYKRSGNDALLLVRINKSSVFFSFQIVSNDVYSFTRLIETRFP